MIYINPDSLILSVSGTRSRFAFKICFKIMESKFRTMMSTLRKRLATHRKETYIHPFSKGSWVWEGRMCSVKESIYKILIVLTYHVKGQHAVFIKEVTGHKRLKKCFGSRILGDSLGEYNLSVSWNIPFQNFNRSELS